MKLKVEHIQAAFPVTVMALIGEIDASNYMTIVEKVADLYQSGTRNLLIDLSQVPFMASSGLVAFHRVVTTMRGESPAESEKWKPMRTIAQEMQNEAGQDTCCKFLNPRPRVAQTLQVTGFDKILAIYFDREEALASFAP